MKKYKVGDRVKVYGYIVADAATKRPKTWYCRGLKGVVVGITNPKDEIIVEFKDRGILEVHPKQCRKIKCKNHGKKVTCTVTFTCDNCGESTGEQPKE